QNAGVAANDDGVVELIRLLGRHYYRLPPHQQTIITQVMEYAAPGSVMDHGNIDWNRTALYSFEPGGLLRVNLEGRESNGVVAAADYEALIDAVIMTFESIVDPLTGE